MEERDRLINKITEEVLAELENICPENEADQYREKSLVVIPEFHSELEKFVDIIERNNQQAELVFAQLNSQTGSALPGEVVDLSQKNKQIEIINGINKFNHIYYICPGVNSLKAITEMNDSELPEWLVIQGLLQNIEVEILINYKLKEKQTGLTDLVSKMITELKNMGIAIGNINETEASKTENKITEENVGKELITRKEIKRLHEQGQKQLDVKNSVITPLALDKARELNIKVNY